MTIAQAFVVRGFGLAAAVVVLGSLLTAHAADPAPAKQAADSPNVSAADQLVHDALAAELAGDDARRDALLAKALAADPNCRAARWQLGYVNVKGKWLTLADAAETYCTDSNLTAYRTRREEAAKTGALTRGVVSSSVGATVGGSSAASGSSVDTYRTNALTPAGIAANADLARWCGTVHLAEQERAHWMQVLFDDPTNSEAQSRLGLHWYQGNLLTTAQINAIADRRKLEATQLAHWKPIVLRWRMILKRGSATEQSATIDEMHAVTDVAVIPALEAAEATGFAKAPADRDPASTFQREAVALLGRLPGERAAYTLVQWSIMDRQSAMRTAAADELKRRPLHDFVPTLLAGLANPVQFDFSMSFDPSLGLAIYRAVESQEGQESINRVEYSNSVSGLLPAFVGSRDSSGTPIAAKRPTMIQPATAYDTNRQSVTPGPRNLNEVSGAAAIEKQGETLANSVEQRNKRIQQTNGRIDFVLERVIGKKKTATIDATSASKGDADEAAAIPDEALVSTTADVPQYWWNWWADYTETYQPDKQVSSITVGDGTYTNLSTYPALYQNPYIRGGTGSSSTAVMECFSAGTPIATQTGLIPIEKLQIGDAVLAQNPDTGELAFKPVIGATIRPPVETVLISTTRGEIRATRGHPFWIVGQGWRMAKEVQIGDRLHSREGGAVITAIKALPPEQVYNLTVADFGTYFVGEGQILVHDNSPRLPSRAVLPGFVANSR